MSLVIAVAMAIPPVLLCEFGRRYSFAHLLTSQALIVDAAVTVSLIAILVGLAWAGHLKAFTAVLTLDFACGSCALTWLLFKRRAFDFDRKNAALTIRSSFELGKWLLLSQLALQMQGYATHWITMLAAGAVATGLYSACLSIVALANPFLFGYFNILTPRFVRVFKQGRAAALRRRAVADAVLLGAGMGIFTVAIWVFGGTIMGVLFPGEYYRSSTGLLTVLALSSAAGALGGPAVVALSVVERGGRKTAI